MNKVRIERKPEDLYRINIADDGTEIVFDLADISLAFKCNKAFQEVEKNKQVTMGKIQALKNKQSNVKVGLLTETEKQIIDIYNEMYKKNREILDELFGCKGAMDKLFGDANYMDMYDDLAEQFEPHFEKMGLNIETIKKRLSAKYSKKNSDVLA